MKTQKISDREFRDLLLKELDGIKDFELLILKGHILIEYSLNKYINEVNDGGIDIDGKNFTFHKKITVAEMLGLFKMKGFLRESIIDINRLRNQIAHKLSFEEKITKGIIKVFVEIDEPESGIEKEKSDFENFYYIVIAICGLIIGRKMAMKKIKKFTTFQLQAALKKNPEKFQEEFKNFANK